MVFPTEVWAIICKDVCFRDRLAIGKVFDFEDQTFKPVRVPRTELVGYTLMLSRKIGFISERHDHWESSYFVELYTWKKPMYIISRSFTGDDFRLAETSSAFSVAFSGDLATWHTGHDAECMANEDADTATDVDELGSKDNKRVKLR